MHLSKHVFSAAAIFLFATSTFAAHAASIVTDGDFSGGVAPAWSLTGSGIAPGIGVTSIPLGGPGASTQYGDIILDSPGGSASAAYFVDDNANETISQNVFLAASTSYVLTFELYGVPSGAGNSQDYTLTDSIGGSSSSFTSSSVTVGSWTLETLDFTSGAAGSYALDFNFLSGGTPARDVVLSDVAINPSVGSTSAVPEPSAIALFGSGLLGLAGVARRKLSRS